MRTMTTIPWVRCSFLPMVVLACCLCQNGFAARKPMADVPKGWVVDYEGAKETARRDAKRILIAFTGSNWCPWSKKLQTQILANPKFVSQASKDFVLVMIDVPKAKDRRADSPDSPNVALKKEFHASIPGVVITDADGREIKSYDGYKKGSVEQYLQRYRDDFGCVRFSGKKGLTPAMTNVVEVFRRQMPVFRLVFEGEVDGAEFQRQYPVVFVDSPGACFKADAKGAVYPTDREYSDAERDEMLCSIAVNAYGGCATPNQAELIRYFAKRIIRKEKSSESGLFGAWDKIGLSQKAIMRNYFMMKGWKPRISMKKAKRITVDEEAAFMSDAAGMDAFAIYREFGISADDKKSVYGWGGFQLKKELTIPHGWTAEELE